MGGIMAQVSSRLQMTQPENSVTKRSFGYSDRASRVDARSRDLLDGNAGNVYAVLCTPAETIK